MKFFKLAVAAVAGNGDAHVARIEAAPVEVEQAHEARAQVLLGLVDAALLLRLQEAGDEKEQPVRGEAAEVRLV